MVKNGKLFARTEISNRTSCTESHEYLPELALFVLKYNRISSLLHNYTHIYIIARKLFHLEVGSPRISPHPQSPVSVILEI